MEFEGNFRNKREIIRIRCKDEDGIFKDIELLFGKRINIENRCIEFVNYKTSIRNYLYVLEVKCKCCLINKQLTYVYTPVKYFFSRSEISNTKIKIFASLLQLIEKLGLVLACYLIKWLIIIID